MSSSRSWTISNKRANGERDRVFEIAASVKSDYAGLTESEQKFLGKAVSIFKLAAGQFAASGDPSVWPGRLRARSVTHAKGVYEMTWSFSGPDGRATWEWISLSNEDGKRLTAVRWRRIGGHDILNTP